MASRIAALEQRIDALEEALRVQATVVGQYLMRLGQATDSSEATSWMRELMWDMRRNPGPTPEQELMQALLYGLATVIAPTAGTLRAQP